MAARPFCVRNAAVAGRQETLAVTPTTLPLCSTKSHPAVQTVGLTVLFRSADLVAQYVRARKLEVHFPLPGRSREARAVCPVHHRDDPTSTANRLVSGDLFYFESSKRSRNVVLSDVVWGGFLGEFVEHILRQLRWQILRHVARGGWHRACSVVPKGVGEHPRRACRRVYINIGA